MTAAAIVVVFLSYAHSDKTLAKAVVTELNAAGCTVWSDQKLKPGRNWARDVQAYIDRADVIVTLVSKASTQSYWVTAELMRAQKKGKAIVPVIVDRDADLPLVLSGLEWGIIGRLGEDVGCHAR